MGLEMQRATAQMRHRIKVFTETMKEMNHE